MAAQEEKLLQFQVHVDESHLIQHIQRTVQKALQLVRGDLTELRHHTQRLMEDMDTVKKDMYALKTGTLRKMLDILLDVRSAVTSNSMGSKAYQIAVGQRKEEEEAHGWRDLDERIELLSAAADDSDVCLDSERIGALEVDLKGLSEQFTLFVDEKLPLLFNAVSVRQDGGEGTVRALFRFLGLSHSSMHTNEDNSEHLLNSAAVHHSEQSIAMSQYLRRTTELVGHTEGRVGAAESALLMKINADEMERVTFALTDLRGLCDVTRSALEAERREREEKIAATARTLQQEVDLRVSWTSLEQWKLVVNEALLKTKEGNKTTKKEVDDLRVEHEQTILELEAKVATLLLHKHHESSVQQPPPSSARGQPSVAASKRLESALTAATASVDRSEAINHSGTASLPSAAAGSPSPFSTATLQHALSRAVGMHDSTKKTTTPTFAQYAGVGSANIQGTPSDHLESRQRPRSALLIRRTT